MTDGRIPGKWMSDPVFVEMSADTWCVLTKAITWSNEAGTDGLIKRRYLALLHPDGDQPEAYAELVRRGLWTETGDGYQFSDWSKPSHQGGLGQSTAEHVRTQKERKRLNQQDSRSRKAQQSSVTGDVTDLGTGDVGQDTTGQASTEANHLQSARTREDEPPLPQEPPADDYPPDDVNPSTGEIKVKGWPTAPVGQSIQQQPSAYPHPVPYGQEPAA